MTTVTPITDDAHFESLTSSIPSSALQVRYFHAPWAAPCAQMSTVLEALASTYPASDPPKISFLSIDAEELPEISEAHDVTAVPYIVLQRDGKALETISGGDAIRVRTAVEKHFGLVSETNGGSQLPPPQQVTRPAQQPLLPQPTLSNSGAADATQPKTNGSSTSASRDLSSYAPKPSSDVDPSSKPQSSNEPQDLHARLTQLTNAAPVMLFMKGTPSAPQCGFSRQLVSILRENSVRYGFFNILADEEVRQGLKEFADWPTFPQLWMSGELVGGLDIVKEELSNDPEFFNDYSVDGNKKNQGGPAAAEHQKQPVEA